LERFTVTADAFRKLALDLPDAIEAEHMGHPDFRVGGKIFATIGPDGTWGMVKLTPEQQTKFVRTSPKVFQPVNGTWGRRGATKVILKAATKTVVTPALVAAWTNTAPQDLLEDAGDE
jgi:hypothetical protein